MPLALLLKFWREGVIGFLALLLLLVFGMWRHSVNKFEDYKLQSSASYAHALEKERARMEQEREVDNEVTDDLREELESIRNARPVPVVRVCKPASRPRVPVSVPAGSAAGAAAPGQLVPESPGQDIGPELYSLAQDADEIVARCRALQQWNKALSTPPVE